MSKKPRSRVRDLAEYAAVRTIETLFSLLPTRVGLWFGRRLGSLFRLVDRGHRNIAEQNVAMGLALTPHEARQLVRKMFRNLGATFVEGLMLPAILRRSHPDDFAHLEGAEHLTAALAQGRGAIIVTAHMGNWEMGCLPASKVAGSMMAIARPMRNPLLDRNARKLRATLGTTIVDRQGAMRHVLRHLHNGGLVAMLIDQNQRSGGVFVDFFGKLASTVPTPASIALKYNVPVLAACTWRDDDGFHHHFHCDPPFELIRTGNHKADVVANTAMFTKRIEEYIRRHPDQWFWLHQRWRKRPPEELEAQNQRPVTDPSQEKP